MLRSTVNKIVYITNAAQCYAVLRSAAQLCKILIIKYLEYLKLFKTKLEIKPDTTNTP